MNSIRFFFSLLFIFTALAPCNVMAEPDTQPTQTETADAKPKEYKDAKTNEQSLANKGLTTVTTTATGIGAMELARGLSEQKADKDAEADMDAYIKTFRCEYGNGKSFSASEEEIEIKGGNDTKIIGYRNEYIALASDLKARKEALGINPGIESEEILDDTNLYDDDNVGITSGNEASLYRAKMLKSETDQEKLENDKDASGNRVKYGAIAAGAGVVVGVIGDSLINGEMGKKIKELIKERKDKRATNKDNERTISLLKEKLSSIGVLNTDSLDLSGFDISSLEGIISNTDWSKYEESYKDKDVSEVIDTSNFSNLASSLSVFGLFN